MGWRWWWFCYSSLSLLPSYLTFCIGDCYLLRADSGRNGQAACWCVLGYPVCPLQSIDVAQRCSAGARRHVGLIKKNMYNRLCIGCKKSDSLYISRGCIACFVVWLTDVGFSYKGGHIRVCGFGWACRVESFLLLEHLPQAVFHEQPRGTCCLSF